MNTKRFDYADSLALQIRAMRLPEPVREFRFDSMRKWRFDLCWPQHTPRFFVEVDGGERVIGARRHGGSADHEKQNAAVSAGWIPLRFSGSQVKSGAAIAFLEQWFQDHP